jgi:hypothetical protein
VASVGTERPRKRRRAATARFAAPAATSGPGSSRANATVVAVSRQPTDAIMWCASAPRTPNLLTTTAGCRAGSPRLGVGRSDAARVFH